MWRLMLTKQQTHNAKNEVKIRCEEEIFPDGYRQDQAEARVQKPHPDEEVKEAEKESYLFHHR